MKTAALAQSVERRSRKAKVSGSIPEGGSSLIHVVNIKFIILNSI